ncbi:MAG: hypothetical protein ABR523_09670, partial [Desulfurivibrionaceae bacterium]
RVRKPGRSSEDVVLLNGYDLITLKCSMPTKLNIQQACQLQRRAVTDLLKGAITEGCDRSSEDGRTMTSRADWTLSDQMAGNRSLS